METSTLLWSMPYGDEVCTLPPVANAAGVVTSTSMSSIPLFWHADVGVQNAGAGHIYVAGAAGGGSTMTSTLLEALAACVQEHLPYGDEVCVLPPVANAVAMATGTEMSSLSLFWHAEVGVQGGGSAVTSTLLDVCAACLQEHLPYGDEVCALPPVANAKAMATGTVMSSILLGAVADEGSVDDELRGVPPVAYAARVAEASNASIVASAPAGSAGRRASWASSATRTSELGWVGWVSFP